MLWCDTAGTDARDVEDLAVFVSQLTAAGMSACIHVHAVPGELGRNTQFDLAPFLREEPIAPADQVVLLAAHRLKDAKLAELSRIAGGTPRPCSAYGSFASRQAVIATTAKLSYVLGQDPHCVDLTVRDPAQPEAWENGPVIGVVRRSTPAVSPRLLVAGLSLADPRHVAGLAGLALSRKFRTAVLTDGQNKRDWISARGNGLPIYHYGEILPASLAERAEICALFSPLNTNYRLKCLVANFAVSGGTLLDCTQDHAIARTSDAFLKGPPDLASLGPFVTTEVLPNLVALGTHVRGSTTAGRCGDEALRELRKAAASGDDGQIAVASRRTRPDRPASKAGKLVFMPTNGVGLGHAQRCVLIAHELDRASVEPVFAAFPSCAGLVKAYGFAAMPLFARSALHAQSHENDLANYLRLRALAQDAQALAFDGGYVFDSVYRTVLDHRLRAVWVRRGLWQNEQDNTISLDREKAFERVIVPSEAFGELNAIYSEGAHVHPVGPIVRQPALTATERAKVRERLSERYGLAFEHLVVTQLGGGVAADRGAQIQAVCGMLERRTNVLHLVLLWPTAALEPGWFRWSQTRVVKTHHAGVLADAADLCVTAVGYNTFHEVLYGARAAIFVPQTAGFMDDQRARAAAAFDRGLAGLVEPHQLMTLEREISRYLDGGEGETLRQRIAALDLPERGNAKAAKLIAELTHADAAEERPARADRARRRR